MESFFGCVNYDFDNKYYLFVSICLDEFFKFYFDYCCGIFWFVGGFWRLI